MAGRPVASRGGGLTGLHYALFSFVFVTVLALVGFVLMLTKAKDIQSENERLAKYRQDTGSAPAYLSDEAVARNSSVFAVVEQQTQDLAQLITGRPTDKPGDIKAEVERRIAQIAEQQKATVNPGDTLLTVAVNVSKELARTQAANNKLESELAEARQKNETLESDLSRQRQDFQSEVAALDERITQVQSEYNQNMELKDNQLSDVQAALDERSAQYNRLRQDVQTGDREKDILIGRLNNQIEGLQEQVKALKPETFDPDAILAKSDGRIVRAIPGADIVYINLGTSDNIKVGMGFEVYSQSRETPQTLRGKASIEVVSALDETSECRVTRATGGQPIIEGDLIVNIAYEKNRKPKFLVLGDFDLNYDGQVDFDGAEKVKAMIREWGGQVVDSLDESTSFVIIGAAPFAPGENRNMADVSPVVAEQMRTKELARSQFQDVIRRAQAMFVPVIVQDQFLFLMGYTGS